jgi:hypothetical protein
MRKKKEVEKKVTSVKRSGDVPKLLKPEDTSKFKPVNDHADNIQQVMGIGLGATYDLAVANDKEVTVAKVTHQQHKLGNVDNLPKPVKKKK